MAERLGIDAQVIAPCLPPDRTDAPVGARSGKPYILLVGSLQPRKGVDVWARSLNIVLHSRPDVSAVLIGPDTLTGPGETSMLRHVRQLISRDVRPRLRWCGALTSEETRRAIASAALVVVPSRFESFSYVGAEALLAGRPVILSDRVGLGEWTDGLPRVPADDPRALAEAQLAILGDLRAAARSATRCRADLLETCPPARHLEEKRSCVSSVAAPLSHRVTQVIDPDEAIERMRRFLLCVERAETLGAGSGHSTRSLGSEVVTM
jgi:glycosyltransferase involved in cell wall biosynthesis